METHILTVLTHWWFAAEIAPVEEQKGFTKRLTVPTVQEGANEGMKFLFSNLVEKWTTTRGGKFGMRDYCLALD